MKKDNKITFRVFGKRALFSTPESKIGGEKFSYQIPTYEALVGITNSIYWKPTIRWVIDRVRIMKPIQTESVGIKLHKLNEQTDLSFYTYLKDVEYEVEAHFEWNEYREDLKQDRNENKHYFMAKRALERGGRRDIFLGVRECQAYVEPVEFGQREGAYDNTNEIGFGFTFHSFIYPDQNEENHFIANFWHPVMRKGIVDFIRPEECKTSRIIKKGVPKEFTVGENMELID